MTEIRQITGKLLGVATLGERGQMVLPKKARHELGLNKGDKLIVLRAAHGGLLLVSPEAMAELFSGLPGLSENDENSPASKVIDRDKGGNR